MVLKMVYDISNIKDNLATSISAVNGMMTAKDEQEKNAWVTIYNSRISEIFAELEIIKTLEPKAESAETTKEPEPTKSKK